MKYEIMERKGKMKKKEHAHAYVMLSHAPCLSFVINYLVFYHRRYNVTFLAQVLYVIVCLTQMLFVNNGPCCARLVHRSMP